MFYPTGEGTEGRTLVCLKDNEGKIQEVSEDKNLFLAEISEWLDENNYCVEKWQLKQYMEDCGCSQEDIEEMEGGAAGGYAMLDTTPGMGNAAAPGADGTPGSGDMFPSLTVGTGAAKKGSKKTKRKGRRLSMISDFDSFVSAMKKNQGAKKS